MKVCTVCEKLKHNEGFYYRDKRLGKLHSQCKQCYIDKRRGTYKVHYHKYGSQYRARALIRNRKLKTIRRSQMLEYLSDKSCIRCGISDPRVLDFDHIDPTTKNIEIARGIHNIYSWEKILVEIAKCQILCSNCHRIKTAEQNNWYKNPSSN